MIDSDDSVDLTLFYGDNLQNLRCLDNGSVSLIYIDPQVSKMPWYRMAI